MSSAFAGALANASFANRGTHWVALDAGLVTRHVVQRTIRDLPDAARGARTQGGGIRGTAPRSREPNVLLDALIGVLGCPAHRGGRGRQFHFIAGQGDDGSLLLGSDPVWPCAALHLFDDNLVDY